MVRPERVVSGGFGSWMFCLAWNFFGVEGRPFQKVGEVGGEGVRDKVVRDELDIVRGFVVDCRG